MTDARFDSAARAAMRSARDRMVTEQIESRGVSDPRVLAAMRSVPRELFVPPAHRDEAHADRALPIGPRQTISQPYMVAYMTEQLQVTPQCRTLEIGTGTGYQTAILAQLAARIWSIEADRMLAVAAARRLADLGVQGTRIVAGDGSVGWPDEAPFDRIIATAGCPQVPEVLVDQLADGGVLIIPVGAEEQQTLVRVRRRQRRTIEEPLIACRFVKMIGAEAWPA